MESGARHRPPLKWAGNKYAITSSINRHLKGAKSQRLVEPFLGAGALFLNTEYDEYILGDTNQDLINFYQAVKEYGAEFIRLSASLFKPRNNTSTRFYALRDEFNGSPGDERKAALFLYLNRHGYNGLIRYNAAGRFNVPFGRYIRPYFPQRELSYLHERAKRAQFKQADFTATMAKADPGDVIYCDPPYIPLSATAHFTAYSAGGFGESEQRRLAESAEKNAARGIRVVISNHDTRFARQIYARARKYRIEVRRSISCNGAKRNMAKELIVVYYPSAMR